MRIATWNLDCELDERGERFVLDLEADILLLTEVPAGLHLPE